MSCIYIAHHLLKHDNNSLNESFQTKQDYTGADAYYNVFCHVLWIMLAVLALQCGHTLSA